VKKHTPRRHSATDKVAELRKLGQHDEARRELERQAKRFYSSPEPPDERAERRAFFEAAKRALARDPEPDFPEAERFTHAKPSKNKPRRRG
jgi:hypothetical protein